MDSLTLFLIALGVVLFIGAHVWLHKLVKFKMDESAIVNFFKQSAKNGTQTHYQLEDIATNTKLKLERVALVCAQSKQVKASDKLWSLV